METNSKQENQPKWQEKFNSFIEQFIINKKSLFRDFEMDFNNDECELAIKCISQGKWEFYFKGEETNIIYKILSDING